jgi:DNA-binding transcriptional MerR regulator
MAKIEPIDPTLQLRFRSEAARMLRVSEKTLREWQAKGKGDLLPSGYVGEGPGKTALYTDKAIAIAKQRRDARQKGLEAMAAKRAQNEQEPPAT